MLTDEELITLKNALEILVKFQLEEKERMKTIDDESLGYHQRKRMVDRAYWAEVAFAKFVFSFEEK